MSKQLKHVSITKRKLRKKLPPLAKVTPHAAVEQIESIFFLFISATSILFTLLAHPARLEERLRSPGARNLPRYSFLSVCAFLAVKCLKIMLSILILGMVLVLRGCDPETQRTIGSKYFLDDLASLSIEHILLIGLPIVFTVMIVIRFTTLILRKFLPGSRVEKFGLCAVYIAGFQYIILATAAAILLIPSLNSDLPLPNSINVDSQIYNLEVTLILPVVWGSILYSISFIPTHPRKISLSEKINLLLCIFIFTPIFSTCIVTIGLVAAMPIVISDLNSHILRPALNIIRGPLKIDPISGDQFFTHIITNVSAEKINFLNQPVFFFFDDIDSLRRQKTGGVFQSPVGTGMSGAVNAWTALPEIIPLQAGHSIVSKVSITNSGGIAPPSECFKFWTLIPFSLWIANLLPSDYLVYPIPKEYWARECFVVIDNNGERTLIVAVVRGDDAEPREQITIK